MFHQCGAIIIWIPIVVAKDGQIFVLVYLFCDNAPRTQLYPSHSYPNIRLI